MNPEEYRKKIQKEILQIIKEKLESGEMKAGRAREIAKMVLEKLKPGITLEEIYHIVPTLDDKFPELASVVFSVLEEYQQKVENPLKQHISNLIKSGRFSQATQLIDKTIKKQLKLKNA